MAGWTFSNSQQFLNMLTGKRVRLELINGDAAQPTRFSVTGVPSSVLNVVEGDLTLLYDDAVLITFAGGEERLYFAHVIRSIGEAQQTE